MSYARISSTEEEAGGGVSSPVAILGDFLTLGPPEPAPGSGFFYSTALSAGAVPTTSHLGKALFAFLHWDINVFHTH